MSEQDQVDLLQIVKDIQLESQEWRKANDLANAEFRRMLMEEFITLKEKVSNLEKIVNNNNQVIETYETYLTEIKGASKYGKIILSIFIGASAILGALWAFLTAYFTHKP